MRSKVLVSVLVVLALLFSFGMAEKASADSLMFPWIVKSSTVTTLVSVVNISEISGDCMGNLVTPKLHYQYWYKGDTLTGTCNDQSFERQTSQNDIVSFDASGQMGGGAALFNDQPPLDGHVTYTPNQFAMTSAPAVARAFLLVDNNNTDCFEDAWSASLYGEAMVIQLSQGGAWGYIAYNAAGGGPDGPASEPTLGFNDELDMQGEVMRSPRWNDFGVNGDELETVPMVLLPLAQFKTKMFVTPVNYAQYENGSGPGARVGTANSRIQFCIDPYTSVDFPVASPCGLLNATGENCQTDTNATCVEGGVFDNDESPMDSNLQANVVCTAAIDISVPDVLLTQAQIDYLTSQPGAQAWTYVRSMVGSFFPQGQLGTRNVNTESDSIIGKLEYTEASTTVGNVTANGAVNNFNWIRNSASLVDGDWDLDHGINDTWFSN